jgi:hypothetical protein
VKCGTWEPSQGFGDGVRGERARFREAAIQKSFGQERRASDRRRAPSAEEARFGDLAILQADCQFEDVPAHGIADFDSGVGVWKFAGIARVAEVLENGVGEHFQKYRNRVGRPQSPRPEPQRPATQKFARPSPLITHSE